MKKLSVSKDGLQNALEVIAPVLDNSSTLPILKGIKFEMLEGVLTITSTNIESFSEARVDANGDDFSFVVEGLLFINLIKRLREDKVDLILDENKVKVSAKGFTTELPTLKLEDFPEVPTIEEGIEFKVDKDAFISNVSITATSVSADPARPLLACIRFDINKESITMVSLDGYRLSASNMIIDKELPEIGINVPYNQLNKIIKNIHDDEITIKIVQRTYENKTTYTHIIIKDNNNIRGTKLMEGEYINYGQIIPPADEFSTKISLEIEPFKNALDLINVFKDDNLTVAMDITDEGIKLSSSTSKGIIKREIIYTSKMGDGLRINFNPRFFDVLSPMASQSEKMIIFLKDPLSPMIITPTDSKVNCNFLILPVRVNESNK